MKTTVCRGCPRRFRQRKRGRQWYCKACRLKRQKKDRKHRAHKRMARYYRRLRRGLCPECGGWRDGEGIQCRQCREQNKNAQRRCITSPRRARYMRRLLKRRRREGMCAYCGREIDEPGYRMCSKCRKHGRDYYYIPEVHEKVRLYAKDHYHHEPVPICKVCGCPHLRCDRCQKFMKATHGNDRCIWTCRCGIEKTFRGP